LRQIEEIEPTLENMATIKETFAKIKVDLDRAKASITIAETFRKKAALQL